MNLPGFTIAELAIPGTLSDPGDPDVASFLEAVSVRNAVQTAAYGTDALSYTAEETLPYYQLQEYEPRRLFVARTEGRIVGRAVYEWSTEEANTASWAEVEVLPEFRGRGIGTALLDLVEGLHAESGRETIQGYVAHGRGGGGGCGGDREVGGGGAGGRDVGGDGEVGGGGGHGHEGEGGGSADREDDRLVPPTGAGSISADGPGARFLLAHGYTLEQVARGSSIRVPLDPATLAEHRAAAEAAAGTEYRVLRWTDSTPERWIDDLAVLHRTMSTADPSAGLNVTEEVWDAERVRSYESALLSSGRLLLTAAAEHLPSGRLAGFTRLSVPADRSRPTSQEETLVLEEHRGHRLGMLLKVANFDFLASEAPESPLVYTFNAEENRHMLSVNEAVGFVPMGHEGAWKKVTR